MSKKRTFHVSKEFLLPGLSLAFLVRWCVAGYGYSGYNKPPMYGDFEAQRHWQEITVHTPIKQWYVNTTQNDLQYWGLDYPPLTAYHSYIMGLVADWLEPESVRLFASRGYERDSHKTFMRFTVFICDIYFYVSAVLCLCLDADRVRFREIKNVFKRMDVACLLFLLYPGLILIDHGHFQYNCVSLGLFLWATFFINAIENDTLATIFFILAINYKQMELYHALPFFCYLLKKCFVNLPTKRRVLNFIHRLNKVAIPVVSLFIVIWFPFMKSKEDLLQVIHRLFPINRGVFEDKVSNVWCVVNVFIKLKTVYKNNEMATLCLMFTILACMPSCLDLFIRINKKKFVLSLINVSLAFFLFSFQVHEKSILLAAIPVALHLPDDPFMCFWFLLVSNFSMLPLILKDGLLIPYISTNVIYIIVYSAAINLSDPNSNLLSIFNAYKIYGMVCPSVKYSTLYALLSFNFFLSLCGMILLTMVTVFYEPPIKYPDLFPLLISVYSCVHFVFFYLYFNYKQLSLPVCLPLQPQKVSKKGN